VVQVPDRDKVREALARQGILTGIHFPVPLHLQPACERYGWLRGSLPVTEAAAEHILSLPMYAELTEEQIEQVGAALATTVALAEVHG
jgi:dTDP-4-amino-4,6-dideoxygalactose transaminase